MTKAVLLAAVLSVACGAEPRSDPGRYALLQVERAQFYEGRMPRANGGPEVVSVALPSNGVEAGARDVPLRGTLGHTATAALLGLVGDAGYWVVPAGVADFAAPESPTADATLGFSTSLAPKAYTLRAEAVDADGRVGAPFDTDLAGLPRGAPAGRLVVTLGWDTEADLDLHVVTPNGVEVFARNVNSVEPPPPGKPTDPEAWKAGGILDFDSNAGCTIDGLRQEDVVYAEAPPSGHYVVRVDTFSLCDAASARWKVTVTADGRRIGRAQGTSGPSDAELPHDRGGGVLALEFDVP